MKRIILIFCLCLIPISCSWQPFSPDIPDFDPDILPDTLIVDTTQNDTT